MAITLASDSDHCDSVASRLNITRGAEMKLNKIQIIGEKKAQRKRRIAAIPLSEVAASKIPHLKGSYRRIRPTWRRAAVKKG
jgi:hypothetical protein